MGNLYGIPRRFKTERRPVDPARSTGADEGVMRIRVGWTDDGISVVNEGDFAVSVSPSECPEQIRDLWRRLLPGETHQGVGTVVIKPVNVPAARAVKDAAEGLALLGRLRRELDEAAIGQGQLSDLLVRWTEEVKQLRAQGAPPRREEAVQTVGVPTGPAPVRKSFFIPPGASR